jgi:hypothetical protein
MKVDKVEISKNKVIGMDKFKTTLSLNFEYDIKEVDSVFINGVEFTEKRISETEIKEGCVVYFDTDGKIDHFTVNGREFTEFPPKPEGSIHTRLNMMDEKLGKATERTEKVERYIETIIERVAKLEIDNQFEGMRKKLKTTPNETEALFYAHTETMTNQMIKCSACGLLYYTPGIEYLYCPHCGRKIVEGRE